MKRFVLLCGLLFTILPASPTPEVFAENVSATLSLVPPSGTTNTFLTVLSETRQGLGTDTNTTTASGSILFDLEADFNPVTQDAAVSGIAFSNVAPGTITYTDMVFSNFLGGFGIETLALLGTLDTPTPFSSVVSGDFLTDEHQLIHNGGRVVLVNLATNELSAAPAVSTLSLDTGTIQLSTATVAGTTASYEVVLRLPVSSTGTLLDDVNFKVDMTMDGVLVASGTFSRAIPVPEVNNAGGASDITVSSAVLNGELVSTGALPTSVSVYYGLTDEDTDKTAWDHLGHFGVRGGGPLSTNIMDLLEYTTYYYRFFASNDTAQAWAPSSAAFTTLSLRPVINNDAGASAVTETEAVLNGELVTTGSAPSKVSVYWGKTDGGTDIAAWANAGHFEFRDPGVLSTNLSGLTPDTSYFYRYYATNAFGARWADTSVAFLTPATELDPERYTHRMKIGFEDYDPPGADEVLTNFPLLVVLSEGLTSFRYDTFAVPQGIDLRFTASNRTTLLNYEVEKWNTNGNSLVWVQVPALSSNGCLYAYWGNPETSILPDYTTDGSAWDPNYAGVWHLKETSGTHFDSTSNRKNGTPAGGVNQSASGRIDGGDRFDGDNDYVDLPNGTLSTFAGEFMISLWANFSGRSGRQTLMCKNGGSGANYAFTFYKNPSPHKLNVRIKNSAGTDTLTGNTAITVSGWHHIVLTMDSDSRARIWLNGTQDGTKIMSSRNNAGDLRIGYRTDFFGVIDGRIDEVRILREVRSANWIWAAYANQKSAPSFPAYEPVVKLADLVDTDGDGMPDFWEDLHFGGTTNGVADTDNDGDTFDNLAEWIANTIPTNSASFFKLEGIESTASHEIFFDSSVERVYTLQFIDDLLQTVTWSNIQGQARIPGAGIGDSLLDTNELPTRSYRIKVEIP